jgi:hypothetical protein
MGTAGWVLGFGRFPKARANAHVGGHAGTTLLDNEFLDTVPRVAEARGLVNHELTTDVTRDDTGEITRMTTKYGTEATPLAVDLGHDPN